MPELGTYNFSVTINGETVEKSDDQDINRLIPAVDTTSMIPFEGDSIQTTTPFTFTWGVAGVDLAYTVYYGIQIRDQFGNYVVNSRYINDFTYTTDLSPGDYRWQVITVDGPIWSSVNNRINDNWINFTITE